MTGYEYLRDIFYDYFGVELKETCQELIDEWQSKYSIKEIKTAINIACEQYSDAVSALERIGGILYNRSRTYKKYFKDSEE